AAAATAAESGGETKPAYISSWDDSSQLLVLSDIDSEEEKDKDEEEVGVAKSPPSFVIQPAASSTATVPKSDGATVPKFDGVTVPKSDGAIVPKTAAAAATVPDAAAALLQLAAGPTVAAIEQIESAQAPTTVSVATVRVVPSNASSSMEHSPEMLAIRCQDMIFDMEDTCVLNAMMDELKDLPIENKRKNRSSTESHHLAMKKNDDGEGTEEEDISETLTSSKSNDNDGKEDDDIVILETPKVLDPKKTVLPANNEASVDEEDEIIVV
ncbi:hypothetical protein PFISCL1PPCAC_24574, partial [Pristionchus fissidentatus]